MKVAPFAFVQKEGTGESRRAVAGHLAPDGWRRQVNEQAGWNTECRGGARHASAAGIGRSGAVSRATFAEGDACESSAVC